MTLHEVHCPLNGTHKHHSDAAKRVRDTVTLHRLADPYGSIGKWCAVALSDGTSDNVLYDTRRECIRHQHHDEMYYAYIQLIPATMTECQAEAFLIAQRKLYDAGLRLPDPDHRTGGMSVIDRATNEDQRSLLNAIASKGRIRASNLIMPWERPR